jgi:DNA-binding winged helix-turn-helix (wHTH) protein
VVDRHEQVLAFGPFELYRGKKVLLEGGKPVRLGSRAFDILTALVERAGEVVGKNELMRAPLAKRLTDAETQIAASLCNFW